MIELCSQKEQGSFYSDGNCVHEDCERPEWSLLLDNYYFNK